MKQTNKQGNGNQVAGTKLMTKVEMKTMIDRMVIGQEEAVLCFKKMLEKSKVTGEWQINAATKLVYHLIYNNPMCTKINIEAVYAGEVIVDVCGPIMEFDKVYCELIGRAYIKVAKLF